jgi:hypothetical protein
MLVYRVKYINPNGKYEERDFATMFTALVFSRSITRLGGLADDPIPLRIGR